MKNHWVLKNEIRARKLVLIHWYSNYFNNNNLPLILLFHKYNTNFGEINSKFYDGPWCSVLGKLYRVPKEWETGETY